VRSVHARVRAAVITRVVAGVLTGAPVVHERDTTGGRAHDPLVRRLVAKGDIVSAVILTFIGARRSLAGNM
jgi:hypothetical protein